MHEGFGVFTVALLNIQAFWDMTRGGWLSRFGAQCHTPKVHVLAISVSETSCITSNVRPSFLRVFLNWKSHYEIFENIFHRRTNCPPERAIHFPGGKICICLRKLSTFFIRQWTSLKLIYCFLISVKIYFPLKIRFFLIWVLFMSEVLQYFRDKCRDQTVFPW
jgi:hypothetical protein